jgi:hypothetical protein
MTPQRVILLLIAGVLVIAGALWISSQRHLERATLAGDSVLPGLEKSLNAITEVHLSKGDGTRATLKKGATDWTVTERNYPADSGRVRKLLLDLSGLKVVEEKTRNHALYAQLGVEDANSPKATSTLVELITPAKTYALLVGKPGEGQNGFVRVAHTEPSLLGHPLVTVDADPRHWLDRAMVDIAENRIKQAAIEPATGPSYTAAREAAQQDFKVTPIPKGRELSSSSAANELGSSFSSLQADDVRRVPAAPAPGAAKPDHALFRTFNGLELDVTGFVEGEHHFVALLARATAKESQAEADAINQRLQGWQFEIPSYKYQPMFRPLEELLKKPEPAKPKATTVDTPKKRAK